MVADLSELAMAKRLVVKVGSALLVEDGRPRRAWLNMLAQDLWGLRREGVEIIVVSSGAIALGAAQLDFPERGRRSLADSQAAAAVGQIALAELWTSALGEFGLTAAQMLLTLDDLEDRRRYLNASSTLDRLLQAGAIPVINENDSVATEEIRFGDNDRLAARVGQAANADLVLLLSDVDGLYTRDPSREGAELIADVHEITPDILAMASSTSSSGLGSGGMISKLQAAQIATRAGIALAIINGTWESPIANAVASGISTLFHPLAGASARKAWLGGRLAAQGTVRVDNGCAEALQAGASLLAAGVVGVSGAFNRGDLVSVVTLGGKKLAQGLSEYSSSECQAIAGKREGDQADILGYAPRAAVIHRDHMVML